MTVFQPPKRQGGVKLMLVPCSNVTRSQPYRRCLNHCKYDGPIFQISLQYPAYLKQMCWQLFRPPSLSLYTHIYIYIIYVYTHAHIYTVLDHSRMYLFICLFTCEPQRLDSSINELYLFHGSSPAGVLGIGTSGFNLDLAGSRTGMMSPGP